jgi:hypothetical protein
MSPVRTSATAAFVAAAALFFASPARAAVELLSNPGFEPNVAGTPSAGTGDTAAVDNTAGHPPILFGPWNGWNNWVSPYGSFYTGAVSRTGSQAGKTYSGPNAGMYQAVTGIAGHTYTASGWFDDRSADALGPTTAEDVRIIFQDASHNAITGGTFPSVPFTAATATKDTWTPISVTAVAPPGTAFVEYMAFFNNPANEGGAMYLDDASLTDTTPIPEPASLGLISIGTVALLGRRKRRVTA